MEDLKFKGTKGTWELRGSKIFIKDTFLSVAEVHVQSNYEPVTFKPKKDIEAEANSKLIASAPDLLEALTQIQFAVKTGAVTGLFKDEIEAMDKAIEKALK